MPEKRWSNRTTRPAWMTVSEPLVAYSEIELLPDPCDTCQMLTMVQAPGEGPRCANPECAAT